MVKRDPDDLCHISRSVTFAQQSVWAQMKPRSFLNSKHRIDGPLI